jgi:hypothetical protein
MPTQAWFIDGLHWSEVDVAEADDCTLAFQLFCKNGSMCWRSRNAAGEEHKTSVSWQLA